MKTINNKLRFSIWAIFAFLYIGDICSQTFVCTDMNYYDSDLSDKRIQEEKVKTLGSKAVLSLFDKNLKITLTDNDGETHSFVLDRISDNEYQMIERQRKMKIKLVKLIGYIRTLTIEVYKDDQLSGNVLYKRE